MAIGSYLMFVESGTQLSFNSTHVIITRLLRPPGITVAHKLIWTIRTLLLNSRSQNGSIERHIQYSLQQLPKTLRGPNWKKVGYRTKRESTSYRAHDQQSLTSMHVDEHGDTVNWDSSKIIDREISKRIREFIKALWSSNDSINQKIDLDPSYVKPRIAVNKLFVRKLHNTSAKSILIQHVTQ